MRLKNEKYHHLPSDLEQNEALAIFLQVSPI